MLLSVNSLNDHTSYHEFVIKILVLVSIKGFSKICAVDSVLRTLGNGCSLCVYLWFLISGSLPFYHRLLHALVNIPTSPLFSSICLDFLFKKFLGSFILLTCFFFPVCETAPNQFAHVICGHCRTTLMYPHGAPSVKCAVCQYVTNVNVSIIQHV